MAVHMYDESIYPGRRVRKSETVAEMASMALFEIVMMRDEIETSNGRDVGGC